jgi:hypothetical protein
MIESRKAGTVLVSLWTGTTIDSSIDESSFLVSIFEILLTNTLGANACWAFLRPRLPVLLANHKWELTEIGLPDHLRVQLAKDLLKAKTRI